MGANSTLSVGSHDAKTRWAWHLSVLGLLVGLILTIFSQETINAVQVWWIYDTYTHCFLIIPISAWLIWQKRDELQTISPTIAPSALLAIPPLLLFWLVGKFATINEVRQLAVVGLIQVAILAMLGARVYRAILFPALYLFFLVPVGQYLVAPMQDFATRFTDIGLTLLGVPHFTEGTLIELPTGRFEIAEACAGLRFMIATVTLGVLFAHLTYRRSYKIILFLIACIAVPLIANGLRCVGIIMLAYLTNNRVAVGVDHLVYGFFFNIVILLALFFVGSRFRDLEVPLRAEPKITMRRYSLSALLILAASIGLAIYLGPAFASWHDNRPIAIYSPPLTELSKIDGSIVTEAPQTWKPIYNGVDREFLVQLVSASPHSPAVDLAIEYYGRMRDGHSIIATTNRLWDPDVWRQLRAGRVRAQIGNSAIQFNERVISSTSEKRLLWYSYWMDSGFTTSATIIKLLQLKTAFVGDPAGALVAVSTPIDGSDEDARIRLREALSSVSDLPGRLAEVGRSRDPLTSAKN
jgi:exosortase A